MKPIVLLIEDDVAVRETLVRILERSGFNPISAASGDEALRLAAETVPHAIVTDYNMPNMNGVEAVRAIRRTTALFALPALVISGLPVSLLTDAVERLGAARLIAKPFLFGELVKAVREACAPDAEDHLAPA